MATGKKKTAKKATPKKKAKKATKKLAKKTKKPSNSGEKQVAERGEAGEDAREVTPSPPHASVSRRPLASSSEPASPPSPKEASHPKGGDERPEDPLDRFFFSASRAAKAKVLVEFEQAPEAGWREALEAEAIEAFLTFRMSDEWYAVRISALQEIVKLLPLTPVPRTPEHVEGVVTLRGKVLPVLDLHLRLGLARPPAVRSTRLLVLDSADGVAAFVVEEVGGVWRPEEPIREPPPTSLGPRGELIEVLLRADARVLPLLDLDAALAVDFEDSNQQREARSG